MVMKKNFSETDQIRNDEFRDRRRLEIKRRFMTLQARRSRLERELSSINALLASLDSQMQHYCSYEQLSLK